MSNSLCMLIFMCCSLLTLVITPLVFIPLETIMDIGIIYFPIAFIAFLGILALIVVYLNGCGNKR